MAKLEIVPLRHTSDSFTLRDFYLERMSECDAISFVRVRHPGPEDREIALIRLKEALRQNCVGDWIEQMSTPRAQTCLINLLGSICAAAVMRRRPIGAVAEFAQCEARHMRARKGVHFSMDELLDCIELQLSPMSSRSLGFIGMLEQADIGVIGEASHYLENGMNIVRQILNLDTKEGGQKVLVTDSLYQLLSSSPTRSSIAQAIIDLADACGVDLILFNEHWSVRYWQGFNSKAQLHSSVPHVLRDSCIGAA